MVVVLTVGCGSAGACPAGQLGKRRAGQLRPGGRGRPVEPRGPLSRPSRRCGTASPRVRAMAEQQLRTVLAGGGFFEGPRWHEGSWWVSGFYRRSVSRVTPDGAETVVVEVEGQPSGLGWLPDGSLVVVSMKDHRVLRYADGTLSTHADLTEHCGGHLNDLEIGRASCRERV